MEILWLGGSSFLIKNSLGKRLLIDPFLHNTNLELSSLLPNCITLSHYDFDLFLLEKLRDKCPVISSSGYYDLDFCKVRGFDTFHDNQSGDKRGKNIIYKFEIDDISFLHLGDLGHMLSNDLIKELGHIDLLFIPVGGHISIDGTTASILAKKINPSYVIPMYYRTVNGPSYLDGPQLFVKKLNTTTVIKENPFSLKFPKESTGVMIVLPTLKALD